MCDVECTEASIAIQTTIVYGKMKERESALMNMIRDCELLYRMSNTILCHRFSVFRCIMEYHTTVVQWHLSIADT